MRHVNRPGEALSAANAAVDLWRQLASADSTGAHLPQMANALAVRAEALRRLGRHDEAVTAATSSVELLKKLSANDPDAYQPYLANALALVAVALRQAGRPKEASAVAVEAINLCKSLSDGNTAHLARIISMCEDVVRQTGASQR